MESDLETKLVADTERHGGMCRKWVSPGYTGVPDRLVFMPGGRLYLVELKFGKGGTVSPRQRLVAKILNKLGFGVYYVRDDAERLLFWRYVDSDRGAL